MRSGTRQKCILLPLMFNILLELLNRTSRQGKGVEVIQIGNEDIKISQPAGDAVLYKKIHIFHKNNRYKNDFRKVPRHKISTQK